LSRESAARPVVVTAVCGEDDRCDIGFGWHVTTADAEVMFGLKLIEGRAEGVNAHCELVSFDYIVNKRVGFVFGHVVVA
jgi:hypothetical protein